MRQFVLVETFREVCIRLDIGFLLQKQLDAYIRINEALALYLILSILVYTFFSRMFDLMLPPVAKHSIVVA